MKTPVMLLLTNDNELEESVADALSEVGGISHLAHDAGDALETICGVDDLDLAIIDFEHGPHGMTLLSAISTLREDLPVIVITRDDEKHVEALAYANGATACFSKQAVGDATRERDSRIGQTKGGTGLCLTGENQKMQTMKANVFRGPNKIGIEEVPRPSAGVGEAVIRITLTTICGTDLHILRGEYPVKPGLVIGHEPVGVIEELGEGGVRIQNRRSRFGWRDHAVRSMSRLFVRAMGAMRSWRRCRSDRRLAIRQHD